MSGRLRASQSMTSASYWSKKAAVSRAVWGWELIVLSVLKVTSKHPRRPWQHLIPQDLDVPMPVHGSIHHDQLTPPPMVDCIPYHDGPRFPSLGLVRHQSSSHLAYNAPNPTVTVVWGEPGLITEEKVSPLSEVPHFVLMKHVWSVWWSMCDHSNTQFLFHYRLVLLYLTHWGRDKIAAIFQTTFSNPFS